MTKISRLSALCSVKAPYSVVQVHSDYPVEQNGNNTIYHTGQTTTELSEKTSTMVNKALGPSLKVAFLPRRIT